MKSSSTTAATTTSTITLSTGRDRYSAMVAATNHRSLRFAVVVTVVIIMMFTVTSLNQNRPESIEGLSLMFCSAFQPRHGQTNYHRRRSRSSSSCPMLEQQVILRRQQQRRTHIKSLWVSSAVDEEAIGSPSLVAVRKTNTSPSSQQQQQQQQPTLPHEEEIRRQQDNTRISSVGKDFRSMKTSRSSCTVVVDGVTVVSDDDDEVVPTTMSDAIQRFFLGGDKGPSIVVGIVVAMTYWRFFCPTITNFDSTWKDGVAASSAVVFWWFQEHFLHQKVLHSNVDWIGKQIHEEHHDKPYYHVSIDSAPLLLIWMTVAHMVLFRWWLPFPLALSATIGYALAGLTYEWSHYIVHTRVKLTNKFWVRIRDNHIRHHRLSHDHWFSFTMPWLDDLFGTNPPIQQVQQARRRKLQQRKLYD